MSILKIILTCIATDANFSSKYNGQDLNAATLFTLFRSQFCMVASCIVLILMGQNLVVMK